MANILRYRVTRLMKATIIKTNLNFAFNLSTFDPKKAFNSGVQNSENDRARQFSFRRFCIRDC